MSGRGYVDPNFPNPGKDGDASFIIYGYTPNFAFGVIAIISWVFLLAIHLFQGIKFRSWYYSALLITGMVMEIVGYIMRCLSSKTDPYLVVYFVVQYFMIVVAPVFFSAAVYQILCVMVVRLGKQYSILAPKLILAIFISFDVVTTIIQVAGAALIGSSESNQKDPTTGNNILLAGLSIQVFSFAVFLVVLVTTLLKIRKVAESTYNKIGYVLLFCGTMIELRTVFRLTETAQGVFGFLSSHEVFFGTLEYFPLILAIIVLAAIPPGKDLGASKNTVRNSDIEMNAR